MPSCRGLLEEGRRRLERAGVQEAEVDARLLFFFAFQTDWNQLLLHYEEELSSLRAGWDQDTPAGERDFSESGGGRHGEDAVRRSSPEERRPEARRRAEFYLSCVDSRARRIPLQYITREQNFCGFPMYVDERVLIPRQDTELLVEEALKVSGERGRGLTLLDLCTGSGCIPVALSRLGRFSAVSAGDISRGALQVAELNARRNRAPVELAHSDLWEAFSGRRFDMITSNPPYIPSGEIDALSPEVGRFEPRLALDGAEDGLAFYRRIAERAPEQLNGGGVLLLEIGCHQAEAVQALLRGAGLRDVRCVKDLSGLDRIVTGRKAYV